MRKKFYRSERGFVLCTGMYCMACDAAVHLVFRDEAISRRGAWFPRTCGPQPNGWFETRYDCFCPRCKGEYAPRYVELRRRPKGRRRFCAVVDTPAGLRLIGERERKNV